MIEPDLRPNLPTMPNPPPVPPLRAKKIDLDTAFKGGPPTEIDTLRIRIVNLEYRLKQAGEKIKEARAEPKKRAQSLSDWRHTDLEQLRKERQEAIAEAQLWKKRYEQAVK